VINKNYALNSFLPINKKLKIPLVFVCSIFVFGCQSNQESKDESETVFRKGIVANNEISEDTSIHYKNELIIDETTQDNNYFSGEFDSKGYLWLGKLNCLVRYNGYEFKK
jgi:hypothetical protein